MSRSGCSLTLCLAIWWPAASARAYTFEYLDYPGASSTTVRDINDSGKVVGSFSLAGYHGFVYHHGTYTQWDYPAMSATFILGVNDSGHLTGQIWDGTYHGFRNDGTNAQMDAPGAFNTYSRGLNDVGAVVGSTYNGFGTTHTGFLYDGGYTPVEPSGAYESYAEDINDSNVIVGRYKDGTLATHGFLRDDTGDYMLDVPGGVSTQAYGINDWGAIVGHYFVSGDSQAKAFIYDGSSFQTVNVPGTTGTFAYGISNWGVIAGTYTDADYDQHGFIAYPEPGDLTWIGDLDRDDDGLPDSVDATPVAQDANACDEEFGFLTGTLVAGSQTSCRSSEAVDTQDLIVEAGALLAITSPVINIHSDFAAHANAWVRLYCCPVTHPPTREIH